MSDRKLHTKPYSEWREHAADEYAQAQRRAFLDGFETAANEAQEFQLLREWLEQQRDKERELHEEQEDDMTHFVRHLAFKDVLVKLSEMGCRPEDE